MKKLFLLTAVLAAASFSVAEAVTGIAGTVTDAVTGDPIAGAQVMAPHGGGMVLTDSTGGYLMRVMRPGRYVVHAAADGYEPAVYPDTVVVEEGQVVEGIDFELEPQSQPQTGAISGYVTDAVTGDPIVGARVHTCRHSAYTDDEGYYIIENILPGSYLVYASAMGYEPATYPDTVYVEEGQTTEGIDFELVPVNQGTGAISGYVTDSVTGDPIARARVHTPHRHEAYTDDRGFYIIEGLAAGGYVVYASAMGYEPAVYPDTVYVEEGQTVEDIDFALAPKNQPCEGSISGVVTDETSGEIIRGAIVKAENEGVTRQVTQCCRGYTIGRLPPGKYWVSATAPGYEPGHYPDSVEVLEGQRTDEIDFALVRGGGGQRGGIAGTVTSSETGDPILGAMVVASGPTPNRANTNIDGDYLIRDLVPGTYVVHANARGFRPSMPETVLVVAGQVTEDVDFELEPWTQGEFGAIAGMVTDSVTGDPIPMAHVFARGPEGQGMTYTDSSGVYVLGRLPAGPYLVRAAARSHYPAVYPETLWVTAGETIPDIDFELGPCPRLMAGIGGYVYHAYDFTEIVGATVTAIGPDGSLEATTDEWGEYLFAGIEPGDYRIEIAAPGYADGLYPDVIGLYSDEVEGFAVPAVYPLAGVAELPAPVGTVTGRLQSWPNPFRNNTTVRWQVPVAGRVSLSVVDKAGRVVASLHDGFQNAGSQSAKWNGTDGNGRRLASGVYFFQLDADGSRSIHKVVLTAQ